MSRSFNKHIKPTAFLSYRFTAIITLASAIVNIYSWYTNHTKNIFTGYIINAEATMKAVTSLSFIVLVCLYFINKKKEFQLFFVLGLAIQCVQILISIFDVSFILTFSSSSFITLVMFILAYTSLFMVKFKNKDRLFLLVNSITYIISSFAIFYYLFGRNDFITNIIGFESLSWNTSILFFINSIAIYELILIKKINLLKFSFVSFKKQHPFYYFPLFFLAPIIITTAISVLNFFNIIDFTAGIYIIFLFLNFSVFISMFIYSYQFIDYFKDTSEKTKKIKETNKRLRSLNEELNEKNLYLDDFATLTSHNLREPIIALKELFTYYKDSVRDQSLDLREMEDMYKTNVENLNYGLNALINYHKFIKDIDNQFPNKINLSESLEKTYDELEYLKPESTQLNTNIEADIELPKSYINNIFSNLFTNSFKFKKTTDQLNINVSTFSTPNYFHILYKDNGVGFDADLHKKDIFKKRKRFHAKNISSGGYGLYYLKLYVSKLNGEIDLYSKVDKGTLVRIKLQHEQNSDNRR